MRKRILLYGTLVLACVAFGCGGDDDGCDSVGGTICTNCAGDCPTLECSSGTINTCVGLEFFGDSNPDDLRCQFCSAE